jgi:hypothetical protein
VYQRDWGRSYCPDENQDNQQEFGYCFGNPPNGGGADKEKQEACYRRPDHDLEL